MAANVWEWVADWYDEDYYQRAPALAPTEPARGSTGVLRGGSWISYPFMLRASYLATTNRKCATTTEASDALGHPDPIYQGLAGKDGLSTTAG